MKLILIVLDSVGIGEAPDAEAYGDEGSATLPQTARAVGGLNMPVLQRLGLGNISTLLEMGLPITGVPPTPEAEASFGAMQEISEGKDTITGHWEMAGLELIPGFALFPEGPPSFPADLIASLEKQTGRKVMGNCAASGTRIIEQLGEDHLRSGSLIVYTSADSVLQIAAHEETVPIEELYAACRVARGLCNPLRVGRVIARPFVGTPGDFTRTGNRKDFPFETDEPTVLQCLEREGVPVYSVGKIDDIFGQRGITESNHTPDNVSSQQAVETFLQEKERGFIFANFIDFDMLYGHRRDPKGYARALEQTDAWLGTFLPRLGDEDVLILTADHGNDPTFEGTDHTREYVPLTRLSPPPGRSIARHPERVLRRGPERGRVLRYPASAPGGVFPVRANGGTAYRPGLVPDVRIDQVGVEARVKRLQSRSIKKDAKVRALHTILSMIDLTTLEGQDTPGKVRQLCYKARHLHDALPGLPHVAAVCVYPSFVSVARRELEGSGIHVASVATAFPSGQTARDTKLEEVRHAVNDGADEVDMVISRGRFLAGDYAYVFDEIAAVKAACGPAHLKVILETGELGTLDQVRRASTLAMHAGGDFIKTSTGKIQPAATLPVTLVMLEAIRDFYRDTGRRIGMKPAGGISKAKLAVHYLVTLRETLGQAWLTPDLFRFGASSLANDVLMQLAKQDSGRYQSMDYFSKD